MVTVREVKAGIGRVYDILAANKDLLIRLDAQAGDGDLGVSMEEGFAAVKKCADDYAEADIGKLLMKASMALNEASPSTLGTILSVGILAGGRTLRGAEQADLAQLAAFFRAGIEAIMERAKSRPGEKTILDALCPAAEALARAAADGKEPKEGFKMAAEAAEQGMIATIGMRSVHGRAAYYGEESIGKQDGGATVGKLIFEALAQ